MSIAETIYQHVKAMPMAKAIEVLHFIEFLEAKTDAIANKDVNHDVLEFMQILPVVGKRTDMEINSDFQTLRDEWDQS